MQQFVGEEKNDLLDYLRSLQPEKVLNSHFILVIYIWLVKDQFVDIRKLL